MGTAGKRKRPAEPSVVSGASSAQSAASSKPRKKIKGKAAVVPSYRQVAAQSLPWRRLPTRGYDFDADGGVLELEEIDDVDIVWEETADGGKSAKFKIREDKLASQQADAENRDDDEAPAIDEGEEWTGFSEELGPPSAEGPDGDLANGDDGEMEMEAVPIASTSKSVAVPVSNDPDPAMDYDGQAFDDTLLPGFADLALLPSLKRALHSMAFSKPSEIQERTLKAVLTTSPSFSVAERDVVGVAETGSGKTLAYSLPILQEIFTAANSPETSTRKRALSALILCPTRELALQVRQHIGDVVFKASVPPTPAESVAAGPTDQSEASGKRKKPIPRANIVTVCGGMSVQKQKRLLTSDHGVDIIVATPGRLWELLEEDVELAKAIKQVKFLVLDEADRMIENGHYAELEHIAGLTKRKSPSQKQQQQQRSKPSQDPEFSSYADDFAHAADSLEEFPVREEIRTYVFSATMSKELQRNVQKRGKKFHLEDDEHGRLGALGGLLKQLDFRDPEPLVIDLTPDGGTVKGVQEVAVDCLVTEKDIYLYYFILRYPGRTLVFTSSIDAIRRLKPLLELLELNVVVLHSGMQQRARLKSLDRFKTAESVVLLATDLAARGLDVPAVEHVVHYQLPRTADTYVHRSGRTARAGKQGISLQLCSPEEKATQRALMKSLGKSARLDDLPVEFSIYNKLKERVVLARQIEVAHHRAEKAAHEDNWLQQAAKDMDIEMDQDGDDSDGGRGASKKKSRSAKLQEKELRAALKSMLGQPVILRGISSKYLSAGGSSAVADAMISGKSHLAMIGLNQTKAVEDLKSSRKKRKT